MKNFIKFTATLSALSIILFACGGSSGTLTRSGGASTKCTSNSDCASGQTCNVDWGTCIQPNETDPCAGVTCNSNETCNSVGACVAAVGCTSNAECASTQFCELYSAAAEYHTCVTKKVNGQPCHLINGPGNDCISSTLAHKTCDFALDSICGIGWRADPSGSGGPYCENDSDVQCRGGLYCATSSDGNDVAVNRCYGKIDNEVNCENSNGHQCKSGQCYQCCWQLHKKCH